jgi:hypothetical protein
MCRPNNIYQEANTDLHQIYQHPGLAGQHVLLIGAQLGTVARAAGGSPHGTFRAHNELCLVKKNYVALWERPASAGSARVLCIADDEKDAHGRHCFNLVAVDFDPNGRGWIVHQSPDPYQAAAART